MKIETPLERNFHQGYFPAVTMLRGVAIFLVFIFHFVSYEDGEDIPLLNILVKFGFSGVDVFFIISGFIIPYTMWKAGYSLKKFFRFMGRRLVRLHPPFLVSIALAVFMEATSSAIHGHSYVYDWYRIFVHSVHMIEYSDQLSYTPIYWTLAVELQFYILLGLVFTLLTHSRKSHAWIVLGLFGAASWYFDYTGKEHIFRHGFMFINGIVLFLYGAKKITQKEFGLALILTWAASFLQLWWYQGIVAILTTVVMLFVSRRWKVSEFFGKISYSFYLTHIIFGGWLLVYTADDISNKIVQVTLVFIVSVLGAWGLYHLIERPSIKWSAKIRLKDQKPILVSEEAGTSETERERVV